MLEDTRVETANNRYSFILISVLETQCLPLFIVYKKKLQDKKSQSIRVVD